MTRPTSAARPLVYIAGPFRGAKPFDVEQNVRRAEFFGLYVALAGATPLIPHSMYRFFDKQLDDAFWIDSTLGLLRRCDAILAIPGWHGSVGSRGEVELARTLGMPALFYEVERVAFPSKLDQQRIRDFVTQITGPLAALSQRKDADDGIVLP